MIPTITCVFQVVAVLNQSITTSRRPLPVLCWPPAASVSLCLRLLSHLFSFIYFFFTYLLFYVLKKCSLGDLVSYQMLVGIKGEGEGKNWRQFLCVCVPGEHCSEAPVNIWPMCQWLVGEVPQDITLENVLACSRQQQCGDRVCVCVWATTVFRVCEHLWLHLWSVCEGWLYYLCVRKPIMFEWVEDDCILMIVCKWWL